MFSFVRRNLCRNLPLTSLLSWPLRYYYSLFLRFLNPWYRTFCTSYFYVMDFLLVFLECCLWLKNCIIIVSFAPCVHCFLDPSIICHYFWVLLFSCMSISSSLPMFHIFKDVFVLFFAYLLLWQPWFCIFLFFSIVLVHVFVVVRLGYCNALFLCYSGKN